MFAAPADVVGDLVWGYVADALSQLLKVLGSLQIFGDPAELAASYSFALKEGAHQTRRGHPGRGAKLGRGASTPAVHTTPAPSGGIRSSAFFSSALTWCPGVWCRFLGPAKRGCRTQRASGCRTQMVMQGTRPRRN